MVGFEPFLLLFKCSFLYFGGVLITQFFQSLSLYMPHWLSTISYSTCACGIIVNYYMESVCSRYNERSYWLILGHYFP